MSRKIIFLINPVSGTDDKTSAQKIIRSRCKEENISFEILHTNAEAEYAWLCEKIVTENISTIVTVGGDGTISAVANAVKHLDIKIGIIPRGSGNGLAF